MTREHFTTEQQAAERVASLSSRNRCAMYERVADDCWKVTHWY